ncbi:hypothetical protein NP493_972g00038 [Ridgeia piscesae]|uniref:Kidney mitochondrial carrier protein 1 n=1 Tax=Ridgeia piscesae TaxID=27915 RepID=A0AAD9NJI2_RIDPI|nr:hypothetical protein NP493_972g00038 [Ridgeia piscesae]
MQDWRPFVYGGLASVTAECGNISIDTTKTRLQIQGQKIDVRHTELKYRGMLHAISRISQEEGVRALYSGLNPALLRQATYGTIKIGLYHSLKRVLFKDAKDEVLLINVCCGVAAGVISSCIANPTDVLKVRMQSQGESLARQGLMASFVDIARREGVGGLWRGVGPTANRAAVVAGVELPAYDVCKKYLIISGFFKDNMFTHFISSFMAGLLGAIASNPIDVVKTRMMNQRKLRVAELSPTPAGAPTSSAIPTSIYRGSVDCLLQTYRTEGFMALYKGFIPNWVRLGPWNIIVSFYNVNIVAAK